MILALKIFQELGIRVIIFFFGIVLFISYFFFDYGDYEFVVLLVSILMMFPFAFRDEKKVSPEEVNLVSNNQKNIEDLDWCEDDIFDFYKQYEILINIELISKMPSDTDAKILKRLETICEVNSVAYDFYEDFLTNDTWIETIPLVECIQKRFKNISHETTTINQVSIIDGEHSEIESNVMYGIVDIKTGFEFIVSENENFSNKSVHLTVNKNKECIYQVSTSEIDYYLDENVSFSTPNFRDKNPVIGKSLDWIGPLCDFLKISENLEESEGEMKLKMIQSSIASLNR